MKKNIVITGGLGYIGTELCKLYSGMARVHNITVLDNRFFAKRVEQLRNWGMNYIQGDILNEEFVKSIVKDADVVHHLAGITDVAYVKTEANDAQDIKIINVGIIGSMNIIRNVPEKCRIIFPSTHVVHEGLTETTFNITEELIPTPVLTYSKGKVQTEQDLINSGKSYVILRLGSNYGLSQDNMRINIMPNLFSKITSQNETIKLFSKGLQHKSLIAVQDVARCFLFMEEMGSKVADGIYNCTNENMTVKEVAMLCKKYSPSLNIIETDDEIPNLGYTLSNQKLLNTGFKFLYNIENSVKEMVTEWSKKNLNNDTEYIQTGQKEFVDKRGKISNFELSEPINLIGYIESNAYTTRANHYHPIQEQKVLLLEGQYISVTQDLLIPNSPKITKVINPGDLVVTKPNVAHTMVFTRYSRLLNLVNGEREHENYGITHTIPHVLVTEQEMRDLIISYRHYCRACSGNSLLQRVINLGYSPLANNLTSSKDEESESYPLEINFCNHCTNCQLSVAVEPTKMFDNYLYKSSIGKSFVKHFEEAAEKYINDFNLNENSFVIDIGSNDGIALRPFLKKNISVLGIEPAKNIADEANRNGIKTIVAYFDTDSSYSEINRIEKKADLVLASNVFAHGDRLDNMTRNVLKIIKDGGMFIVEVQYLLNTIQDLTFDNIYHEHVNYWSVTAIKNFVEKQYTYSGDIDIKDTDSSITDFTLQKVEQISTHGGSIRLYFKSKKHLYNQKKQNGYTNIEIDESVERFLKMEEDAGLNKEETYLEFAQKVYQIKENVNKNMYLLKSKYNCIAGYGAPAKATTALNFFGITSDSIKFIIEDNQLKHNKYIPGVKIPIYSKEILKTEKPDAVIVMAWNFFDDIVKNNKHLFDENTEFINIKDLEKTDFKIETKVHA